MDFSSFISIISTIVGILGTLFIGAFWVLSITSKISNRASNMGRDITDLQAKVKDLEAKTSFTTLENIFTKVCFQIFHSKEFKEANHEVIRSTLLHIEANKSSERAGAFTEILSEIKNIHNDIINNKNDKI